MNCIGTIKVIKNQKVNLYWFMTVVLVLGLCSFLATSFAEDITPIDSEAVLAYEQNTIDIAEQMGSSVVAVKVSFIDQRISSASIDLEKFPPIYQEIAPYLAEQAALKKTSGSGFVIELGDKKYLLSNFHVVQPALQNDNITLNKGAAIKIIFPNGIGELPAEVVGVNPSLDLALLKIEEQSNFPEVKALSIADSSKVRVGQKAIAIGNAFGLASTVTAGIVSATERSLPTVRDAWVPMIQTDTAINPGNSGGPLLNSAGELIGINTAILNPSGRSSTGVGFAVPSNLIFDALEQLEQGGISHVSNTKPYLGVSTRAVNGLPAGLREFLGLPDKGVAVVEVDTKSSAAEAGLLSGESNLKIGNVSLPTGGDVIIAANDIEINSAEQLHHLVTYKSEIGDMLVLTILRDGAEVEVPIILNKMGTN